MSSAGDFAVAAVDQRPRCWLRGAGWQDPGSGRPREGADQRTAERILSERERGEFKSLEDFCQRVAATAEEMELLARVGSFDGFGRTRTEQFWAIQHLGRGNRCTDQQWLLRDSSSERQHRPCS